jgi:hypothetical protein
MYALKKRKKSTPSVFKENGKWYHLTPHNAELMFFVNLPLLCLFIPHTTFAVVGVLENLNQSLAVMEHTLPHIFKGATKVKALIPWFIDA